MIKSLSLQNFRSHKRTKLEFHKGINILNGTSGHGKTNTIRALNWIVNNRPITTDRYRSTWGGTTKVKLTIRQGEDSKYIVRKKGKENTYKIEGIKEPLKAFNKGVPDEVKELINFSSLNLQGQHDSPFLLALSGGEVAKYLNKIVQLDKIDLSMFNINKTLRTEIQDLDNIKEQLKEATIKSKEFNWIDEAEGCLIKLEGYQNSLQIKKKECSRLNETIIKIEGYDEEIERFSKVTVYEEEILKLIKVENKLQKKKNKIEKLKIAINNIEMLDWDMILYEKEIKEDQKEFDRLMPKQCPLCGRGE